jgi:deoxyribonuclease V
VNINNLHSFDLSPSEAIELQKTLASKVVAEGGRDDVSLIAGVDVSINRIEKRGRAAVVVVRFPTLEVVAESIHEGPVNMPYIPGLLSFRELPLILPALEQLELTPDLFIVDGQGIAHPRHLGIAAHLGLFIEKPTIGCAKSRLCGDHSPIGNAAGDCAELTHDGQIVGRVARTKKGCRPVYISPGHLVDLEMAVAWVLKLCGAYRLPKPIREAHCAAKVP